MIDAKNLERIKRRIAILARQGKVASGMEARQGGDVKQAPSRSDDSPPGRPNSTSQDR